MTSHSNLEHNEKEALLSRLDASNVAGTTGVNGVVTECSGDVWEFELGSYGNTPDMTFN